MYVEIHKQVVELGYFLRKRLTIADIPTCFPGLIIIRVRIDLVETAFINTTLQKKPWRNVAKTWMEDSNAIIYLRMTLQKMTQNPKHSSQSLMDIN